MIVPPRPKACPGCGSRYLRYGDIAWDWMWERESHHEVLNWQCVDCGAVIDKGPHKLEIVRYDEIRLAPGEFRELRAVAVKGGDDTEGRPTT